MYSKRWNWTSCYKTSIVSLSCVKCTLSPCIAIPGKLFHPPNMPSPWGCGVRLDVADEVCVDGKLAQQIQRVIWCVRFVGANGCKYQIMWKIERWKWFPGISVTRLICKIMTMHSMEYLHTMDGHVDWCSINIEHKTDMCSCWYIIEISLIWNYILTYVFVYLSLWQCIPWKTSMRWM